MQTGLVQTGQYVNDVGNFLESVQEMIFANTLNNTYKLALIMAIADIALEESVTVIDAGKPLEIPYQRLAEKFLEIYWPQTRPYPTDKTNDAGVQIVGDLVQGANAGRLRIFSLIEEFCADHRTTPADLSFLQARRMEGFEKLVNRCRSLVVVKNPLQYISGCEFLFTKDDRNKVLVVTALHAALLRRFHTIVTELAKTRWEAKVRGLDKNAALLGESSIMSLREYLFNQTRKENLTIAREILFDVVGDRHCFYCGRPLRGETHVDHFVPYRLFNPPRIHNFVLACQHCNTSKSDTLAADDHAQRWVERNLEYGQKLYDAAGRELFPNEYQGFYRMVKSTYENALFRNERFWVASDVKAEYTTYDDPNDKRVLLRRFEPLLKIGPYAKSSI